MAEHAVFTQSREAQSSFIMHASPICPASWQLPQPALVPTWQA